MLLTIHDANLQKVAFIDNEKQSTLNYYDDTWTRNLETGSSTFEFTVFKKAIKSDTASHKTYNYLNEKAFVSFKYHSKSYVFSVMTVEENEQTIKCYCENLNLELINEYANPYKATKAMSFVEYCNAMDLLNFTYLSVGINEISDQKRKLEWEGQDTKLARLLSLATKFDAEIDFETELNADSSIKTFRVNVYHEYDDEHQGVGRIRNDMQLTYGKNLKSIKRKIDKTGIYNAVRPTGKGKTKNAKGEEVETVVTIGSLGAWSENNADGVREFYQKGDMLYAPLSMQMYPSAFTSETTNDQWIRKDMEVESDNPTVIRAAAIRNLRKNAYPALTYEVDGFLDVEIGDTIRIYDDGFSPLLLVQARVSDQKISFTNPRSNKTTFANFKALENNLSGGIQAAFERFFEAAKPYTIKLATDNGVIFKNQIGQSLVTPTLYKGGKPVVAGVTWRWSLDGAVTTGMTYLVKGSSVTDTVTLTVAAYIGNDEVAVDEISLVNVVDGKLGTPGEPGKDGRTSYVHTAWANNATGTDGFSLDSSVNKLYIGIYNDFEPNDSTDPKKYKWTKIKGDKGDKGEKGDPGQRGLDGLQGKDGAQGIPGRDGKDGKTHYTHIAYSNINKQYIANLMTDYELNNFQTYQNATSTITKIDGGFNVKITGGAHKLKGYHPINNTRGVSGWFWLDITNNHPKNLLLIEFNGLGQELNATHKAIVLKPGERVERLLKTVARDTYDFTQLYFKANDIAQDIDATVTELSFLKDNPFKDFSVSDANRDYIGMYVDETIADSINPIDYNWTLVKGKDGKQGIPGEPGADGRTPYLHIAYANSADGRTDFSLTQTGNKRYLGTLTDYTQADSTDPTKYRWVDMVGTVEVGGVNLLPNADFSKLLTSSEQFTVAGTTYTNKNIVGWVNPYNGGIPNPTTNYHAWVNETFSADGPVVEFNESNGSRNWKAINVTIPSKDLMVGTYHFAADLYATGAGTKIFFGFYYYNKSGKANFYAGQTTINVDKVGSWHRYGGTITINDDIDFSKDTRLYVYGFGFSTNSILYLKKPKLEKGNIGTDFGLNPADIDAKIDAKADNALTQEQLNALTEKNQILEAEMQAKASMEAFSELEKAYNSFVAKNEKDVAQSEKDLIEAGRRIELLTTQFGGLAELKTFIDTYMKSTNEGLIIGKNDASSTIKVSSNRISMFSAGKEVMYISQGVIHIDNGIFTASVQIGNFRTEQYHLNADMNVIRYIG